MVMIFCPKSAKESETEELNGYTIAPDVDDERAKQLLRAAFEFAIENITETNPLAFGWYVSDWDSVQIVHTKSYGTILFYEQVIERRIFLLRETSAVHHQDERLISHMVAVHDTETCEIHIIGYNAFLNVIIVFQHNVRTTYVEKDPKPYITVDDEWLERGELLERDTSCFWR